MARMWDENRGVKDDVRVSERDTWVGVVPSVDTGEPEGEQGLVSVLAL